MYIFSACFHIGDANAFSLFPRIKTFTIIFNLKQHALFCIVEFDGHLAGVGVFNDIIKLFLYDSVDGKMNIFGNRQLIQPADVVRDLQTPRHIDRVNQFFN